MVFVVQGAPTAGKSSLGVQLAAHAQEAHGSHVYVLASDEGTRAACVRLGQYVGIDRELLELTRAEGMDALRNAYHSAKKVHLVDADAEEAVFETFLEQIAEEYRPGDPPPILYGDSIQNIRTDLDATFENSKARIAYIMELARTFSRRVPMIIIFVSHVTRQHFASKREEDRIDPLAAAAEAIEITRGADALLDLSGDLHDPQGVKAWLRKNRLHRGAKPHTRLRYDIPKGGFLEIDKDELAKFEEEQQDEKSKKRSEALEKKRQKERESRVARIEALVARRPGRMTKSKIYAEIGGRREAVFELIDTMADPDGAAILVVDEESLTYTLGSKAKGGSR